MFLPKKSVINFSNFIRSISEGALSSWAKILPDQIKETMSAKRWGDMPKWDIVINSLPQVSSTKIDLKNGVIIGHHNDCNSIERDLLKNKLMGLHPWRKGPFFLYGLNINTEWRSDWKWDRVLPHISSLEDRLVLDVGCGNGYHCLRMLGEGASRVIGIDPSVKFVYQFYAIKHFINQRSRCTKENYQIPVDVLPVSIESLPDGLRSFDTVFSMGVIYHRRSPIEHLAKLRSLIRPGGQLVLETLIIDVGQGDELKPKDRYAKMANVWSIPSTKTMLAWMEKSKFKSCRLVDISETSSEEQRASDWMKFESLVDFLDPTNPKLTIEGHPAPIRAIFVAEV